jgi:DNA-binding CsgD family transcriptional regulator
MQCTAAEACVNCPLLEDFSAILEKHNKLWKLTKSEMLICLCLLEGKAIKEIADIRNTNIATVRQQALRFIQRLASMVAIN